VVALFASQPVATWNNVVGSGIEQFGRAALAGRVGASSRRCVGRECGRVALDVNVGRVSRLDGPFVA